MRYLYLCAMLILIARCVAASPADRIDEVKHDRSPQLRQIPPAPQKAGVKRIIENQGIDEQPDQNAPVAGSLDPVVQTWSGQISIPSTNQSFDGISSLGTIPPDTSGEAGLNHYVQVVNAQFAIFDKAGTLLLGPSPLNTLWQGFGGTCETGKQIDPTVVYDQLAKRWLISQIAYTSTTHLQCVAVSTTEDPTGSYYRYAFSQPYFNDYPKIGVWPDGYYLTMILRKPDWTVVGGRICALNRSQMLSGLSATQQCFDVGQSYIGLLPADLDGVTSPPDGSPHYSVNLSTTALNLWKVRINWTTPSSSSISGPTSIPVAAYTRICGTGANCVPQPGVTQKLDVFSDRLMFRLSYRNFGDHEALVVNHTVYAGTGIAGVRWYEIRSPNSSPTIFQQGTYSPDVNYRWMGSIATDLNGDIALGYSAGSGNLFPGIRYTGRLVTDAKNTMPQGESILMGGTGAQTHNRWGDYSSMTIDPGDDCTFWYTNEYIPSNGSFNWHTRIGSFRFPSCGCAIPAGIPNNTAADVAMSVDSGVAIHWSADPGNWGDNASGTRSYDVLRNGSAIASAVPYGTSDFVDTTGVNGQTYSYSVKYSNGCGQSRTTTGASAADYVCGTNSQLLGNVGFESGRVVWTASPTTIINNTNSTYPTHSGSWKATLNGKGYANTAYIYQQIAIPANACSVSLSFWLRVITSETSTIAKDTLKVEILNASGVLLSTLATYSNLNKSTSYAQKNLNLAAYRGQTIRIRFRGIENSITKTAFLIDDTALSIVQ